MIEIQNIMGLCSFVSIKLANDSIDKLAASLEKLVLHIIFTGIEKMFRLLNPR